VESVEDKAKALLLAVHSGQEISKPDADVLRKRRLVKAE
jgi:hypothetical protein